MSAGAGPILVTGATGFLGRSIVSLLVERGTEVEVVARPASERGPLASLPLVWHTADLCDAAAVDRAVASASARARQQGRSARLIHSAALISYKTRDRAAAWKVNVEGTRHVIASAKRHAIERLCFISSVVTLSPALGGAVLDESAPPASERLGVDYVDTKRAAEELVLAESRTLDVVVVNPGAIFGAVERRSNTARLIRETARGHPPRFAPPGAISVVGVRDAAVGTLLALEKGRRGERYLLVESSLATLDLLRRIAHAVGTRPTRARVPQALWSLLVFGAKAVDRVLPLELAPPQALTMLGCELRFDARKARTELGWRPQPFDEVLAETIAGMRAQGWLDQRRSSTPARDPVQ